MYPVEKLRETEKQPSQDIGALSRLSDQLLSHYTEAWKDRQVYYEARQRARSQKDMLVMKLDSFDKCKMVLPRWSYGRTPKRPIYESHHRNSDMILDGFILSQAIKLNFMHVKCARSSKVHPSPSLVP